jgi:hypothetical protein
VKVWNAVTGQETLSLKGHTDRVHPQRCRPCWLDTLTNADLLGDATGNGTPAKQPTPPDLEAQLDPVQGAMADFKCRWRPAPLEAPDTSAIRPADDGVQEGGGV